MVAHNIPYAAQASVGNWMDLTKKVEKAMTIKGPKFINVLQPCQLGWQYPMKDTVMLGQLAIDACFWPLYEVENGVYKLTYKPKEKMPITARDSRRMAWAGLRTEKTSLPGKKRSKSLMLAATHAVRKMDAGFPLAAKARLMK